MSVTYFDERANKLRIKSRYKWGFWCFWAGVLLGVVLDQVLQ